RCNKSALREILIPRRFRLPIPQRLVFNLRRRQFTDAFKTQDGMPEVRDRLMAVLKVVAFQKLLRIMSAYPFDRLPDRIGRPAVSRERIRALFGRHGGNGNDAGSQTAIIAACRNSGFRSSAT